MESDPIPTPFDAAMFELKRTVKTGFAAKIYKDMAAALIERDQRQRAEVRELMAEVVWIAQTVHQTHHNDEAETFQRCQRFVCDEARKMIAEIRLSNKPPSKSDDTIVGKGSQKSHVR